MTNDIIFQDAKGNSNINGLGQNEVILLNNVGIKSADDLIDGVKNKWLEPIEIFLSLYENNELDILLTIDKNHVLNCISILVQAVSKDISLLSNPSKTVIDLIDDYKQGVEKLLEIKGVDLYMANILWKSYLSKDSIVVIDTSVNPPIEKMKMTAPMIYSQILKYNLIGPRDGFKIYMRLLSIAALSTDSALIVGPKPICGSGC